MSRTFERCGGEQELLHFIIFLFPFLRSRLGSQFRISLSLGPRNVSMHVLLLPKIWSLFHRQLLGH